MKVYYIFDSYCGWCYHPDFYEARKIGVTSFPTLFVEINGKHYDLKGSAITLNDIEENLNIIRNMKVIE